MKLLNDLKEKLGSRKLGVTAAIGAAAGTGAVEVTWPIALVASAYVLGQAYVDAHSKYRDGLYYIVASLRVGVTPVTVFTLIINLGHFP